MSGIVVHGLTVDSQQALVPFLQPYTRLSANVYIFRRMSIGSGLTSGISVGVCCRWVFV